MHPLDLWQAIRKRRGQQIASIDNLEQSAGNKRWQIAGASVTGASHLEAGEPCDDAWFANQTVNGFVVAAVSDGAGSAPMGGFAAKAICNAFPSLLASLANLDFDGPQHARGAEIVDAKSTSDWRLVLPLLDNCLEKVRGELVEHATVNDANLDDYLATVVGVIAHYLTGVLCFHIGDGAITVFNKAGGELLTSQPENGDYLNQTYFLVEEDWKNHCRVSDVGDADVGSIFLMTDGATDLAYYRQGRNLTPAPKFFEPLIDFLSNRTPEVSRVGLQKLLDTERAKELVDDDKTIVWINLI